LALTAFAPSVARAQGGVKQGPDVTRDPDMEKESLHNLEAARLYFKLRKAYVASGKSNLYLSEGKGKQKSSLYKRAGADRQSPNLTPEEFRSEARDYFSHLVNEYPDSKFREEALADLTSLGGPKPKESKQ
jgi:hypothetical protein